MKFLTAVLCLAMSSGSASALSCGPWGATDAYLAAANSSATYIIVQGELRFDEDDLPDVSRSLGNTFSPVTQLSAQLRGKQFTDTGFNHPFASDITLEVRCSGPWCAKPVYGRDYLAFLETRGEDYVLQMNPCDSFGLAGKLDERRKQVMSCHAGGACEPSKFGP